MWPSFRLRKRSSSVLRALGGEFQEPGMGFTPSGPTSSCAWSSTCGSCTLNRVLSTCGALYHVGIRLQVPYFAKLPRNSTRCPRKPTRVSGLVQLNQISRRPKKTQQKLRHHTKLKQWNPGSTSQTTKPRIGSLYPNIPISLIPDPINPKTHLNPKA